MALTESVGGRDEETDALKAVLMRTLAYTARTSDADELTGLAVTLPYGDATFYRQLRKVYTACGFDSAYIEWLGRFVSARGSNDMNDYSDFEESWDGWGDYEGEYGWDSDFASPDFWNYLLGDDTLYDSGWYSEDGSSSGGDSEYLDEDAWEYDYEDGLWYQYDYDGEVLYAYDEENDALYAYDMENDVLYRYDDRQDDWVELA